MSPGIALIWLAYTGFYALIFGLISFIVVVVGGIRRPWVSAAMAIGSILCGFGATAFHLTR